MTEDRIMANGWDRISKSYQQRYQIGLLDVHWGPLCPTEKTLGLLGDVNGKRVIEVGSGAGQNSIVLSQHGSISTAFDISKEQLDYGKKLAEKVRVKVDFIRGDFQEIEKYFHPDSFEIAFSAYALQYCKTLDSMNKTFQQIYRILTPEGIFIFSLDHPVRVVGQWEEATDKFVLDNYFDRSQKEWNYSFPEAGITARMKGSFRTISDIVGGVLQAGFSLERLLEPEPIKEDKNTSFGINSRYGKNSKRDPYSFNHLSRVPGTLIIKARKK
ncbi:MAG TPA: class I SAM-dependent methyltransferase [Candidatus Omnitrophota bacterium]|nr:class I SAM-dependent methyltransferase [Candidatus Omnitrophota bacterium]